MKLQVFKNEQLKDIKELYPAQREYLGYVYALEYGNGLKIGRTNNPYVRLTQLKSIAERYGKQVTGRMAVSKPHTNFIETENKLHHIFSDYRKNGTELFYITLEDVLSNQEVKSVELKDETDFLRKKSEIFTENMKSFMLTGTFQKNERKEKNIDEVKSFNLDGVIDIRCVEIDNTPWFVVNDICDYFEVTNRNRILQNLSEEDKGSTQMNTPGGKQFVTVINESGLYSLLFALQPKKARGIDESEINRKYDKVKQFKRWVTSEVLPSIRKHGAYMTNQTLEQALTSPDFLIKLATELKNEQEKNVKLQQTLTEQKPKVVFAEAVDASQTSILVGNLAKLIKQNSYNIGQKRLFEWLRQNGYLIKRKSNDWNMPTQKSMDLGLFEIKESTHLNPDGSIRTTRTPKVTGKGQIYFINKFLKKSS